MTAGFRVRILQGSSEGEVRYALTMLARIKSNAFQPKQTGIFFVPAVKGFYSTSIISEGSRNPKNGCSLLASGCLELV